MLRRSGVKTARILRIGGISALTYGQRASGVSDSMLLQQRRAAASCVAVSTCGANLDLTLLLADERSPGAADPAFEAHVGVVHSWSLAIWEKWFPLHMLSYLISSAQKRLTKRGPKWCLVYGPAGALVLTLRRLNWIIIYRLPPLPPTPLTWILAGWLAGDIRLSSVA